MHAFSYLLTHSILDLSHAAVIVTDNIVEDNGVWTNLVRMLTYDQKYLHGRIKICRLKVALMRRNGVPSEEQCCQTVI